MEQAVRAVHREFGTAVADELLDEAFPKLPQDSAVDVVEAEVNRGELEVGIVGQRGHRSVRVPKNELDSLGSAVDVLREQNVGARLAHIQHSRQIELADPRLINNGAAPVR